MRGLWSDGQRMMLGCLDAEAEKVLDHDFCTESLDDAESRDEMEKKGVGSGRPSDDQRMAPSCLLRRGRKGPTRVQVDLDTRSSAA